MLIISSHAGDLQTISYQVQDMQVTAVCLNGLTEPLTVVSCMAHTATAVTQWYVPKISGMHLGQDTLDKVSLSMLLFPAL